MIYYILTSTARNGGVHFYGLSQIHALSKIDDVIVFGAIDKNILPERVNVRKRSQFLWRILKQKPSYVFSNTYCLEGILGRYVSWVPTVHDLQEFGIVGEKLSIGRRQKWLRFCAYNLCRYFASAILVECRKTRDDLVEYIKVPNEKICVIPCPAFQTISEPGCIAPSHNPRDVVTFFYPAKAWPHKNHNNLIEALDTIENENWRLLLTDIPEDVANRLQKNSRLSKNIHIHRDIDTSSLLRIYKSVDYLILPSLFESISIPIYEASHFGCGIIATDLPGICEQTGLKHLSLGDASVPSIKKTINLVLGERKRLGVVDAGPTITSYSVALSKEIF